MNDNLPNNKGAGKGDAPRNCFSKEFKDNYDLIDWSAHKGAIQNSMKKSIKYDDLSGAGLWKKTSK